MTVDIFDLTETTHLIRSQIGFISLFLLVSLGLIVVGGLILRSRQREPATSSITCAAHRWS